jgi:hypothetical protein
MERTKREQRELKRAIKRRGNKHRRQQSKRDLLERPEDAAQIEETFGRFRSQDLNGQIDHDRTRLRRGSGGEPGSVV